MTWMHNALLGTALWAGLGVQMPTESKNVLAYCAVANALHAELDDPKFDMDLEQAGTKEAAKEFASVWLKFDERLRANAPTAELRSALQVIAAESRSVVGDGATTAPDQATYARSLLAVFKFHTTRCVAREK